MHQRITSFLRLRVFEQELIYFRGVDASLPAWNHASNFFEQYGVSQNTAIFLRLGMAKKSAL